MPREGECVLHTRLTLCSLSILTHAAADKAANAWLSARITEGNGQLAPDILLSRRSYADRPREASGQYERENEPWLLRRRFAILVGKRRTSA